MHRPRALDDVPRVDVGVLKLLAEDAGRPAQVLQRGLTDPLAGLEDVDGAVRQLEVLEQRAGPGKSLDVGRARRQLAPI